MCIAVTVMNSLEYGCVSYVGSWPRIGLAVNVLLYVFIDYNTVGRSIVMCENKDCVGLTGSL